MCTSKFLIKFSDKEGVKLCRDLNTLYTSTAYLRYNWSSTLNNLSSFKAGEKWSYFHKPKICTSCTLFKFSFEVLLYTEKQ